MKLFRAALVIISLFICAVSSQAQPSSIQQLQNSQLNALQQAPLAGFKASTNTPELYPGENVDVGPQEILRRNPRPKYFEVFLDSEVYYSDNADYSHGASRYPSFVYLNTAQIALTPPPLDLGEGKLAPNLGFSSQWYNYDSTHLTALNFDAQTVFAGLKYSQGNWLAMANFNYTRLLNQQNYYYNQTYQELLPSLALERFFVIRKGLILALGDQVDYHITEIPETSFGLGTNQFNQRTDLNDRFDELVFTTLNWQATSHLAIQPFYRFQYSYYRRNSVDTGKRSDFLNAAGVSVIYSFNQYVSARAFVNFNYLYSTDPAHLSYNESNGGVGASLNIKF